MLENLCAATWIFTTRQADVLYPQEGDCDHVPHHQPGPAGRRYLRRPWLQMLRDEGVKAADRWLKEQGANIGVKSALDIRPAFLAELR